MEMSRRFLGPLAGLGLAVAVGVGISWLVDDLGLAVVTGITWGSGGAIALRIVREYPTHATGDRWADKRWTGLGVGIITLAALVGVSATLPISADLRFALGCLVLGTGFVGYSAATMAELERNPSTE